MTEVTWFRPPSGDDPGTLNACYNALDIHVIRGRADDDAVSLDGRGRTYAWLLTEVAACAGVLRAFGTDVGGRVVIGSLPAEEAVVAALAAARVGAVVAYDDSPGAEGPVQVRRVNGAVVFTVDGEDLPWDVAMRAGRTDPAPSADVPGDAILARHRDDELSVLAALGASDVHDVPVPDGASVVVVGGLRLWSFHTP